MDGVDANILHGNAQPGEKHASSATDRHVPHQDGQYSSDRTERSESSTISRAVEEDPRGRGNQQVQRDIENDRWSASDRNTSSTGVQFGENRICSRDRSSLAHSCNDKRDHSVIQDRYGSTGEHTATENVYNRLYQKPKLTPSDARILPYGAKKSLPVDGQCICQVILDNGLARYIRFLVLPFKEDPLLGLGACRHTS